MRTGPLRILPWVLLVVRRDAPHAFRFLHELFAGEAVFIIKDRRQGDRRERHQLVAIDRRLGDRRRTPAVGLDTFEFFAEHPQSDPAADVRARHVLN